MAVHPWMAAILGCTAPCGAARARQRIGASPTRLWTFSEYLAFFIRATRHPSSLSRPPLNTHCPLPKPHTGRKTYQIPKFVKHSLLDPKMGSTTLLSVLFFPFLLLTLSHAATFDIVNRCPYTVWAAAIPGGGRQLDKNQTWTLTINPGTTSARIWPRTNCSFDSSGHGHCQTGYCGGLLACQANGSPPNTLAEYATTANEDFYDLSVVDGFNVPMEIGPDSGSCPGGRPARCSADLVGLCPKELKVPGGCNSHATCSRPTNTAATLGAARRTSTPISLRTTARTHIVIQTTISPAPSLAPAGLTTRLSSALESMLSFHATMIYTRRMCWDPLQCEYRHFRG